MSPSGVDLGKVWKWKARPAADLLDLSDPDRIHELITLLVVKMLSIQLRIDRLLLRSWKA
jgi:hypothetical protein